ncbi:hypothetical protein TBLA_0A04740 [Henningerozyma blattae CBS 6284]|uniref:Endonuclease III homolog n=1 Tax=Henningerozyma blattae (strain ATCC 34711 / CBS 6284 / DSM 70876 / NBRC 10599 / NRRL Y-10934 / UCD 77-7) TaxID=1071380 RepID=I2GVW5_HENB6|nr:hypothetical protein TBLA_0A04740 [Tetrapisispora blattae CBS 6284]CCH58267.1 hypothetical protein TBLA_0A04740 [Tetrapisispora blattae CBS 6284]
MFPIRFINILQNFKIQKRSRTKMVTTRKRRYPHVEVKLEEPSEGAEEVLSHYFTKKVKNEKDDNELDKLLTIQDYSNVDTDWVKTLNSKEYFEYIDKMTIDSKTIWETPLDPKLFDRTNNPKLPDNFLPIYSRIRLMRSKLKTPVDVMGSAALPITVGGKCGLGKEVIKPINYRLQLLVGVMLSAQTKDEVTAQAMLNITRYCIDELHNPAGITLETLLEIDQNVLDELIHSVGFHTRKAKFIKETAKELQERFDSDIPTDIDGLLSLPGVGPKMGYLALHKAWGKLDGICVDVHVHRLSKLFNWVDPKKSKTPEHTRKALQEWLPRSLWYEINTVLVGFGQVICMSKGRRCDICLANTVCNAVDKKLVAKGFNSRLVNVDESFKAKRGDFSQWLQYLQNEAQNSTDLRGTFNNRGKTQNLPDDDSVELPIKVKEEIEHSIVKDELF